MNPEDLNVEQAEKEVEENPCNIKVLSDLGQYYVSKGDFVAAVKNYEKILRVSEDNPRAWVALGHCYFLKKDFVKCINAYQKSLMMKEEACNVELWYGVGLLYYIFEEWKNANKVFLAILEVKSEFVYVYDVYFKVGCGFLREKNFPMAVQYLEKVLELPQTEEKIKQEVFVSLCEAYSGMDNETKLSECYQRSLEASPDFWKPLKVVAWDLFTRRKFKESIEILTTFLKKGKNSSELQYILARAYQSTNDYENARICFSQALSLCPTSFIYWSSAGILYGESGQYTDAFECFTKALNSCQEHPTIWSNIGVLYTLCDQKLEAELSFQRAKSYSSSEIQSESFVHPTFFISEPIYSQPYSEGKLKSNSEVISLLERCITKEIFRVIESLKGPEAKVEEKGAEIVIPKVASVNRATAANTANVPVSNMVRMPVMPGVMPGMISGMMAGMPNGMHSHGSMVNGSAAGASGVNGRPEMTQQAAIFQNLMMNPMMFYQMLYRTSVNMARQVEEEKNQGGDDQGAKALLELTGENLRKKRSREGEVEDPHKIKKEEEN